MQVLLRNYEMRKNKKVNIEHRSALNLHKCDAGINQDLSKTIAFLSLFARDDDWVHISTIPSNANINKAYPKNFKITLNDAGMQRLKRLNDEGYNIYFVPNQTDGITLNKHGDPVRNKKTIVGVRALFLDFDDLSRDNLAIINEMAPKPHCVVCTSEGKYHCYWLVENCELSGFEPALKQLITQYGADQNASDICRLMRVPYFYRYKGDEDPFLSYVLGKQ